ncbi:MAG TPA: hypothetical protein VJ892_04735 [Candidatus Absconditabacterales bacterium]|nr:hypothetical protein [Candidatus Absconditabacterales bacterium]
MPVKKTTKKNATNNKKPVAKKTTAKKTTSKNVVAKKVSKPKTNVIVETKKTKKSKSCTSLMTIIFVVLLLLNLVFGVLNFMKQDSALELEKMKVGGQENFEKVMELYESDFYKEQQAAAIQQFIAQ